MRISVDRTKCIGAGQCVMAAPEVFDQHDDDGTVRILDEQPPAAHQAGAREAAILCPTGALTVQED